MGEGALSGAADGGTLVETAEVDEPDVARSQPGRAPDAAAIRRALAECMTASDIDEAMGWRPGTARRRRWLDLAAGGVPPADAEIGGVPLWFRSTISRWRAETAVPPPAPARRTRRAAAAAAPAIDTEAPGAQELGVTAEASGERADGEDRPGGPGDPAAAGADPAGEPLVDASRPGYRRRGASATPDPESRAAAVAGPEAAGPVGGERGFAEPAVAGSEARRPEMTPREEAGSESARSEVARSEVAGSGAAGREVAGPEVAGPEVAGPEVAGPEVAGPAVTAPVGEPEMRALEGVGEGTRAGVAEPEVAEPEAAESEVAEPETAESEVAAPEVAESEVAEPDGGTPDGAEPAAAAPGVPSMEAAGTLRSGFELHEGQVVFVLVRGTWRPAVVRSRARRTAVVGYRIADGPLGAREQRVTIERIRVPAD